MEKPWISGPKELVLHGIHHMHLGTGFDLRMALICIDNAIEIMIKTYLGLPKRVTGIEGLSRRRMEEISNSFPSLLDGLEEFASEKIIGLELGDIEWFHRIRNQLYHGGNGITVDIKQVESYLEITRILFQNLFEIPLDVEETPHSSLIGNFIKLWAEFEQLLNRKYNEGRFSPIMILIRQLHSENLLDDGEYAILNDIRNFRNQTVHGMAQPTNKEIKKKIEALKEIMDSLE